MLGLGNSLKKTGLITPGIVTGNLVMKHMYPAGAVQPLSDGAAYFDGAGTYVDVGTNFETTVFNAPFSIAFWVKAVDGRPSAIEYLFGTKDGNDSIWGRIETDGDIQLFYKEGSAETALVASAYFDNGATGWTHLAFTISDSAQAIYANGTSIATSTDSLTTSGFAQDTNRNFVIGSRNNAGTVEDSLDGYICNFGIWSDVLTQPEIKSIMFKQYADLTTGTDSESDDLISWWNLDTDANDSTGTNNGTLA
tara:strand:+ start:250 stop:1002 length:753 start_codon:yes stop_codon:yes gene_type:complete